MATKAAVRPVAPYVLTVMGQPIPLQPFTSKVNEKTGKGGNACFSVMARRPDGTRSMNKYGVKIAALSENLPTKAVLSSGDKTFTLPIDLTPGMTTPTVKPGKLTPAARPKVSFFGKVDLPDVGERSLRVSFSQTTSGDWNAVISLIPSWGNAGGGTAVHALDDLY